MCLGLGFEMCLRDLDLNVWYGHMVELSSGRLLFLVNLAVVMLVYLVGLVDSNGTGTLHIICVSLVGSLVTHVLCVCLEHSIGLFT
jgi:hypothetical protein